MTNKINLKVLLAIVTLLIGIAPLKAYDPSNSISSKKPSIIGQCVKIAGQNKTASVKTATDIFNSTMKVARSVKKDSQKLASELTDKTERKLAIKKANDKLTDTAKTLRIQLTADKKLAQETFISEKAKCNINKSSAQETTKKVSETPTPVKPADSNKTPETVTSKPADPVKPAQTVTATVAPIIAQATISNFAFQPQTLKIKKGDSVTWKNNDSAPHTVTGDTGGPESKTLNQGDNYSLKFDQVGTTKYHCAFHSGMKATVEVSE